MENWFYELFCFMKVIFLEIGFFFYFGLFLVCSKLYFKWKNKKKKNLVKKWRNFDIMFVWKKDIFCKKVKKNYWGIKKIG